MITTPQEQEAKKNKKAQVLVDLDVVETSFEKWAKPGHFSRTLAKGPKTTTGGEMHGAGATAAAPVQHLARALAQPVGPRHLLENAQAVGPDGPPAGIVLKNALPAPVRWTTVAARI